MMTQTKLAGPSSAANRQYDLLTARSNRTRDDLSVGQREIAGLWCCDEPAVKREMARLRDLEWLVVQRQGTRGRVTKYRLNISRMMQDTPPRWAAVGPDLGLDLGLDFPERPDRPASQGSVIPFPARAPSPEPDLGDGREWGLARTSLRETDPGPCAAWLHQLTRAARDGSHLTLRAPSAFHAQYARGHYRDRLPDACRAIDSAVHSVAIIS